MAAELIIDRIETWHCVLPLSQPLDFGTFQVRERHYTAMRVHTKDGLKADCVTHTRGSPIDVVAADIIAPRLLGKSVLDLSSIRSEMARALTALETDGALGRAWSLAEICLQDLRAQAAGWPLWRLLGGDPRAVPVQLVEGYALVGESDEAFAERLAARVREGFRLLKIEAAHYASHAELLSRLSAFRRLCGEAPRLVLDFAWSWTDVKSRLDLVERLADLGIEWIEDPFPRTQVEQYSMLRRLTSIPIGCGDEATRPADMIALATAGALDVVRLDAATIGGIESVRLLSAQAQSRGLRVSYHAHPEIHEHCVFGLPGLDHLEVFPTDRPFDRQHDLLQSCTYERVENGWIRPSSAVGSGIRLREDALKQWAKRHDTRTAQ